MLTAPPQKHINGTDHEERLEILEAAAVLHTCITLRNVFEIQLLRGEEFSQGLVDRYDELCEMELPTAANKGFFL